MEGSKLFTSESVSAGHPDKVCDQISDAVLDECLAQDRNSRVACECFAGSDFILVSGEITSKATLDIEKIVRDTVNSIGYNDTQERFNGNSLEVINRLNKQSTDIALGVDTGGAGDQGMMFGYACTDTAEFMPAPIHYAHALTKQLNECRLHMVGTDILKPDGKAQVTVEYGADGKVARIDTIVVSTQHSAIVTPSQLREIVLQNVIALAIPADLIDSQTKIFVNPTGRFVIGGPEGDTGLTGRKIIVDTYGGMGRHGGGCFSGKDPTKVDRSAAYMARLLAVNLVKQNELPQCEVQLAYAIGVREPVSIYVNTFGFVNREHEIELSERVYRNVDLSPNGIIDTLTLKDISYKPLATFGHMGRADLNVPWETLDLPGLN